MRSSERRAAQQAKGRIDVFHRLMESRSRRDREERKHGHVDDSKRLRFVVNHAVDREDPITDWDDGDVTHIPNGSHDAGATDDQSLFEQYMNPEASSSSSRNGAHKRRAEIELEDDSPPRSKRQRHSKSIRGVVEVNSRADLKRGESVVIPLTELLTEMIEPLEYEVDVEHFKQRIKNKCKEVNNIIKQLRNIRSKVAIKDELFELVFEPLLILMIELCELLGVELITRTAVRNGRKFHVNERNSELLYSKRGTTVLHYSSAKKFSEFFLKCSESTFPQSLRDNDGLMDAMLDRLVKSQGSAADIIHLWRYLCAPIVPADDRETSIRERSRHEWRSKLSEPVIAHTIVEALHYFLDMCTKHASGFACILRASCNTEAILVDLDPQWGIAINLDDLGCTLTNGLTRIVNKTRSTLEAMQRGIDQERDGYDDTGVVHEYCNLFESEESSDESYHGSGEEVDGSLDYNSESCDSDDDDIVVNPGENRYETSSDEGESDDEDPEDDNDDNDEDDLNLVYSSEEDD